MNTVIKQLKRLPSKPRVLNANASNNVQVQDYQKKTIERAKKEIEKIEGEIKELEKSQ